MVTTMVVGFGCDDVDDAAVGAGDALAVRRGDGLAGEDDQVRPAAAAATARFLRGGVLRFVGFSFGALRFFRLRRPSAGRRRDRRYGQSTQQRQTRSETFS